MADVRNTAAFKAVAAQVSAELLLRGLNVETVAVVNVTAHMVELVAERMGIQPRSALKYIDTGAVADRIAEAGSADTEGAHTVLAVRPVRVDARTVLAERWVAGHPLMALAQAAKYALSNGDTRLTQHALDLITELGAATVTGRGSDFLEIPVGVLDESADLIERVAGGIETNGWSLCPCGEDHGQSDLDAKVTVSLRGDAALARTLRQQAGN